MHFVFIFEKRFMFTLFTLVHYLDDGILLLFFSLFVFTYK